MRIYLSLTLSFLGLLAYAQKEQSDNAFSGNQNNPARQEWLRDLGFGMFIHFNTDAQLGITISHSLVGASEDYVRRYFSELPATFDPAQFDAYKLAMLARLAGMKYIVFTAKHHSGFCFWNTRTTSFNIMNTPYGKDLLKEYVDGVRRAGLAVGFYYSPEDFKFLHEQGVLINRGDMVFEPKVLEAYHDLIERQTTELFTAYGPIDVLFIDGEPKEPCKNTAWKLQPNVVITRGAVNTPEQTLPGVAQDQLWESCVTMGTQWNYKPTHDDIKSGTRLIELLIESRAKGGNLLLNVGPHPDGYLPVEQETPLREVAAWNFVNGEAIHRVRPWIITNEENIWFTASKDKKTVYAIITGIPDWKRGERRSFKVGSIRSTGETRISVLGQNDEVVEYQQGVDAGSRFVQEKNRLHFSVVRAQRLYDDHKWPNPVVVKLENVLPALDPPVVRTSVASATRGAARVEGTVVHAGHDVSVQGYVEYRVYPGFAEDLYHTEWLKTTAVPVAPNGRFVVQVPGLQPGKEYEFRGVAVHPMLTVKGDIVKRTVE